VQYLGSSSSNADLEELAAYDADISSQLQASLDSEAQRLALLERHHALLAQLPPIQEEGDSSASSLNLNVAEGSGALGRAPQQQEVQQQQGAGVGGRPPVGAAAAMAAARAATAEAAAGAARAAAAEAAAAAAAGAQRAAPDAAAGVTDGRLEVSWETLGDDSVLLQPSSSFP
jgi:regulator of protease activity HflC (stomatin/prohibitin superfamily)